MASWALPGIRSLNWSEVLRPVGDHHLGELVEPECDRRDGKRHAQEHERLCRRIAAQRLGLGYWDRPQGGCDGAHPSFEESLGLVGGLARASRPFLRGKKWARAVAKPLMSVADALPLPAPPIYARLPVDRALADRSFDAPDNSRAWLEALRADGPRRTDAIADLHAAAAGRALRDRPAPRGAPFVRGEELDDLALQAADDALVAVLAKLDDYRGASRFTTWAYKCRPARGRCEAAAASVAGPRGRSSPSWPAFADLQPSAERTTEGADLLRELKRAVEEELTSTSGTSSWRSR